MENKKMKIAEFYKKVFSDSEMKEKFEEKVKKITNEEEFKKLIREEIIPLIKKYNVNFSEEELLPYEEKTLKELSEEDLENVSGGLSAKSVLLTGGLLSMALFAEIGLSVDTSAMKDSIVTQENNNNLTSYTQFRQWGITAGMQADHMLGFLEKNDINPIDNNEDCLSKLSNLKEQDQKSFENLRSDANYLNGQILPCNKTGGIKLQGSLLPNNNRFSQKQLQQIQQLKIDLDSIAESALPHSNNDSPDSSNGSNNIREDNISANDDTVSADDIGNDNDNNNNNSNVSISANDDGKADDLSTDDANNNENNLTNNVGQRTTAECLRKAQQNWKKRQMSGTWQAFEEKKFIGVLAGKFSLLDANNLYYNGVYNGNPSYFNEFSVKTPFGESKIRIRYLLDGDKLIETSRQIIDNDVCLTRYKEDISQEFDKLSKEKQKTVAENILNYFNIAVEKHDKRGAEFTLKKIEISP